MIAQVNTPRQRQRFLNACRGKLCCGATLPLALQLLGKAQPGRFFAGPTLALDIGGRTAWAAGHANPEELASFLNFCGCRAVILDEAECPPPVGWQKTCDHTIFGLAAGEQLPLPAQTEAQKALWDSLTFVEDPASGPVAENLFPDRPARRDDFYSELCTKRSRGKALVWTLEQGGNIVCTVGAYALCNGQAYMACGQTAEALRGQRVGGRLIVQMANALSAQGDQPVFLCSPERVHFYTQLGFHPLGTLARYESPIGKDLNMSMLNHFFDYKPEVLALDEKAMELCQPYFRHMEEIRKIVLSF